MKRLEYMINKFSTDIFFDDVNKLKNDYIAIFEEYLNSINIKNNMIENKFLFYFEQNDFIEMCDFLKYEILPRIEHL